MTTKTPFRIAAIAVAATLLAGFFAHFDGALRPFDGWVYDMGIVGRGNLPPGPNDPVVLGIDEEFMQGRHAYLAPRDRLAKVISALADYSPKVVVLDVWLDSHIDERGDALLRDALLKAKRKGVPVLLSDVPLEGRNGRVGVTAHGTVLPYFRDAAAGTGDSIFEADSDGVLRSMLPDSESVPSMMALTAEFAVGLRPVSGPIDLPTKDEYRVITATNRMKTEAIPIDWNGRQAVVTPAVNMLQQPFLAALLQGKAVFIGATFQRSYDYFTTPFTRLESGRTEYGVQALAEATGTILRGAPRHSFETLAARLQLLGLVFLVSLIIAFRALRGALPGIGSMLLAVAGALVLALYSARTPVAALGLHYWPASPFLIAAVFTCGLGVALRQVEQAQELKLVREAFGAYVGDEVLKKMGGKMPELGGEMRQIAVLFCDIRGYSALAESMQNDPAALMSELNAHFQPLVGALKKRGAYADNYVGDLVMALFGAPISQGSLRLDSEAAVLAAFDFVRLVGQRNEARAAAGHVPIEVGIGLHCGEAVVGNLGTLGKQAKIHYTAIGDAVNIASRVESTTRKYNVPLLVTEEIVAACGDTFEWTFVDETTVKGRVAPVRLYRAADATGGPEQ